MKASLGAVMRNVMCPRCSTKVSVAPGQRPSCPACGFGRQAPAPKTRRRTSWAVPVLGAAILLLLGVVVTAVVLTLDGGNAPTDGTRAAPGSEEPESVSTSDAAPSMPASPWPDEVQAAHAAILESGRISEPTVCTESAPCPEPLWRQYLPSGDCTWNVDFYGDFTEAWDRRFWAVFQVKGEDVAARPVADWGKVSKPIIQGCADGPVTMRLEEEGAPARTFTLDPGSCPEVHALTLHVEGDRPVRAEPSCLPSPSFYDGMADATQSCGFDFWVHHDGRLDRSLRVEAFVNGTLDAERDLSFWNARTETRYVHTSCVADSLIALRLTQPPRLEDDLGEVLVLNIDQGSCPSAGVEVWLEKDLEPRTTVHCW